MAMVAFCGLRRDEAARIGRAVLPKHFFREAADMRALEAVGALPKEVKVAAVTRSFPTVMVDAFMTEYVGFDVVVGAEVKGGAGHDKSESGLAKHRSKPILRERVGLKAALSEPCGKMMASILAAMACGQGGVHSFFLDNERKYSLQPYQEEISWHLL
ncbi:hypothetical protein C2845_PM14G10790 [Panicum miliaceum]|uniref:Glycerol-3-phosphate acyltransferase RAM2/GPAT1-8 HAD-like domain-containing protein n=1 Tax=Panicum miliaceum TaxID=4540 RepID=A0A3L6PTT8_PANMI|nr:hypothetical protein C2845_PM14G10790 [Panicum miliaceum]